MVKIKLILDWQDAKRSCVPKSNNHTMTTWILFVSGTYNYDNNQYNSLLLYYILIGKGFCTSKFDGLDAFLKS